MTEHRRAKRVKEAAQVTIKLVPSETFTPDKKISYHLTKDISSTGLRILANSFLPINSTLKIDMTLSNPHRLISAFGKVRWIKSRYADELFELGIEFVDTPKDHIDALKEHIDHTEGPEET
jgi:c-di-GMP-binding flagellar brake protein YcgR